ncbi:alpha/beta fold hydrolase [Micromonospora sp. NPDC050397]|uniref:alpha/beta fold hydrolase n=1 Tax=Micromonospora sp. NPDC050397 TaxID=3364279 RepID=UPI00384E9E27
MPYISVGVENSASIDLYYEDHGAGQPVVLIHGFPLSGAAWEKQVAALVESGYRAITYDRRGYGKSSQPTDGYDYDTFAADLDQVMTTLDLRNVTLVGHSMGTGEVTRYLAAYGSERVNRAVVISPIPPFLLKTADNPEGVEQSLFDGFMDQVRKDRYVFQTQFLQNFFNLDVNLGKLVSDEVVRANWNVAVSASAWATLACIPAWLTDFRDDLPRIDVPLLIIQGDADRVLPFPVTGKRMNQAIPSSKLVVLKNAPHGIPWTHAEDINRELLNFITERVPVTA